MSKPYFVNFYVSDELLKEAYEILEVARDTGKIVKGTSNTLKEVERKKCKLVFIAENVDPPEIVSPLPIICKEKHIPYIFVPDNYTLGEKCGIDIPSATACITNLGNASDVYKSFLEKLNRVKEEEVIEHHIMYQRQNTQKSWVQRLRDRLPF